MTVVTGETSVHCATSYLLSAVKHALDQTRMKSTTAPFLTLTGSRVLKKLRRRQR